MSSSSHKDRSTVRRQPEQGEDMNAWLRGQVRGAATKLPVGKMPTAHQTIRDDLAAQAKRGTFTDDVSDVVGGQTDEGA